VGGDEIEVARQKSVESLNQELSWVTKQAVVNFDLCGVLWCVEEWSIPSEAISGRPPSAAISLSGIDCRLGHDQVLQFSRPSLHNSQNFQDKVESCGFQEKAYPYEQFCSHRDINVEL